MGPDARGGPTGSDLATLVEPLRWSGATLLRGDPGAAVRALKADDGQDLHLIGSPRLCQALLGLGLVDELRVMVDPVVVGGGKRLLADDGRQHALRLTDSQVTGTGAIITTYLPVLDDHS